MKISIILFVIIVNLQGYLTKVVTTKEKPQSTKFINITEAPYQVCITNQVRDGVDLFQCAGALISEFYVLTAAHCLYTDQHVKLKLEAMKVFAGAALFTNYEIFSNVDYVSVHPEYKFIHPDQHSDDLALVRVKTPFTLSNTIRPISEINTEDIKDDDICQVTGWASGFRGYSPSKRLMKVRVPIYDRKNCSSIFKSSGYSLGPRTFCAGIDDGGEDFCKGDSGGPIVCNDKLSGIETSGKDCLENGYPVVYMDLAKYADWIKDRPRVDVDEESHSPTTGCSNFILTFMIILLYLIL